MLVTNATKADTGKTNITPHEPETDLRAKARARVDVKLSFFKHFASYVVVIPLLAAINLLTTPERLWFHWPALGWGIGVICHGAAAFFSPKWNTLIYRMEERELRKLQEE